MSFILVVREKAALETIEIYIWLETAKAGLGDRFLIALDECYATIRQNPTSRQLRMKHYRHILVEGFNYRVVFAVHGSTVQVYQVRHSSRRPSKRFGP